MASEPTRHETLAFGEYTLDTGRGALFRHGIEVRLRPQSFEVLRHLAENANRLISKDELFKEVWGDTVVTDDSLTQCLIDVRRAIGDESHEIVRTVPRRGYVFEAPVTRTTVKLTPNGSAPGGHISQLPRKWLAVASAAAVAALAIGWSVTRPDRDAAPEAMGAPAHSIAVLAFSDLSEAGNQQYFADGVAEEILNLLVQIPELQVVARTSSFTFREANADIPTIGKALDVAHLLEGSVRRSGNRVRVTAQLVRSSDGSHVWSDTFDRDLGDLLDMQREIAAAIARALAIRLTEGAIQTSVRAVDPAAHDEYLLARFLWSRRSPGDLASAQEHLKRAVARDPNHAQAWAFLSGITNVRIYENGAAPEASIELMRVAIERALMLAPTSGEVHARAAQYFFTVGDFARMQEHWQRARALEPNNMLIITLSAGSAARRGEFSQAVRFYRRAVELDPIDFVNHNNLSHHLATAGQYEEAWRVFLSARELNPRTPIVHELEAKLLVFRGRLEEALGAIERLPEGVLKNQLLALAYSGLGRESDAEMAMQRLRDAADDPVHAHALAQVYAWRGETDAAFEWLDRAQDAYAVRGRTPGERAFPLGFVDSGFLRPLHGDPRFERYILVPGREHTG